MFQCRSKNHWWIHKLDSDKCCSPEWQRILVIGDSGESGMMICESIIMGRAWVRRDQGTGDKNGGN